MDDSAVHWRRGIAQLLATLSPPTVWLASGKDTAFEYYLPYYLASGMDTAFEYYLASGKDTAFEYYLPLLSGFRQGYSTQHALFHATETWKRCLDTDGTAGTILVDLSEANDCTPHDLLIAKLEASGFENNA